MSGNDSEVGDRKKMAGTGDKNIFIIFLINNNAQQIIHV